VHQAGPVTAAARAERLAILLAHRERLAQRRAEIAAAAAYLDHKISVYSEGAK
jgi:hypothetical protein